MFLYCLKEQEVIEVGMVARAEKTTRTEVGFFVLDMVRTFLGSLCVT